MPDYSKGKVYKLISTVDDKYFYVGSTCRTLKIRLNTHKYFARNNPNMKVLEHFNNIGLDKMKIELLEECSTATTKKDIYEREQYYIDQLKEELGEEYCLNMQDAIKNLEKSKIKNTQSQRKRRDTNLEKFQEYEKNWHLANRERRLQKNKENYQNGRKEIMGAIIVCPLCGENATASHLNRHQTTKKCQNNRKS